MQEWMRLPVSQLKRLVKSRAGRIAELQMEVKILEGIMEKKVREGDLGGPAPRHAADRQKNPEPSPRNKLAQEEVQEKSAPAKAGPDESSSGEQASGQTKITEASSNHAFKEID